MRKVLVVEDNPHDLKLLLEYLDANDEVYKIDSCASVHDAIKFLEQADYDVVLLDLNLDDTVAGSSYEELVNQCNFSLPPIIVLTGLEDDNLARKLIQHGAQDYIFKADLGCIDINKTMEYAIERHELFNQVQKINNELRKLNCDSHTFRHFVTELSSAVSVLEELRPALEPRAQEALDRIKAAFDHMEAASQVNNGCHL